MKHKTVAEIAIDVMRERNLSVISWGFCDELDEIGERAKHTTLFSNETHPIDRHIRVLNCLDKSNKFNKFLFLCESSTGPERWCRAFRLKEER